MQATGEFCQGCLFCVRGQGALPAALQKDSVHMRGSGRMFLASAVVEWLRSFVRLGADTNERNAR